MQRIGFVTRESFHDQPAPTTLPTQPEPTFPHRLREEPAAYGRLGLATLLEMREECLREFHFFDAYRAVKQRENDVSLSVLPDLLAELDSIPPHPSPILEIYRIHPSPSVSPPPVSPTPPFPHHQEERLLTIYRMSRDKMKRPWRVDDFDAFHQRWQHRPYGKALLFVDNAGADVVLGMLPLAREMLRAGTNVALVANLLPAIKDATSEPTALPVWCLMHLNSTPHHPSAPLPLALQVVLVANSLPAINDVTADELTAVVAEAAQHCPVLRAAAEAGGVMAEDASSPCIDFRQVTWELAQACQGADLVSVGGMDSACDWRGAVLLVVLEGMGRSLHTNYDTRFTCDSLKFPLLTFLPPSPCLIPPLSTLLPTNLCQLAMIKNERLAKRLVGGSMYDCVCRFQPGTKSERDGESEGDGMR
ncbi:unnamed protein product [Closterium sp. NIES-64]|nr:unnamed protein product [Closterium sp. NIES-64]